MVRSASTSQNSLSSPHNHNSKSSQSESSIGTDSIVDDPTQLRDECSIINSTLDYLININYKKKPGRPAKNSVPDTVNDAFKSIRNINDLHPGVLIDYMSKINSFNKKILRNLESLHSKYSELVDKIENRSTSSAVHSQTINIESSIVPLPNDTKLNRVNRVSDLESKIDTLEQRINSKFILCSGESVTELVTNNDVNNHKPNLVNIVKSILPEVNDRDFTRIYRFGKDRKVLKVECTNISIKNRILIEARKKKLNNIYVSEFLTSNRNKIHYRLRLLKKRFPTKLSAVYIRNGSVFYKLSSNNNYTAVNRLIDVDELEASFVNTDVEELVITGDE